MGVNEMRHLRCYWIAISRPTIITLYGTVLKKPNCQSEGKKLEARNARVLKEVFLYFYVVGFLVWADAEAKESVSH